MRAWCHLWLVAVVTASGFPVGCWAMKEKFVHNKPHVNIGTIGGGGSSSSAELDKQLALFSSGVPVAGQVFDYERDPSTGRQTVPSTPRVTDIVLKRGYLRNQETDLSFLRRWAEGGPVSLQAEIQIRGDTGAPQTLETWELHECLPIKWESHADDGGSASRGDYHLEFVLTLRCGSVELGS